MASEPMQRGKQPVELERDHSSSIRTMHRHENSLYRFQDGNTSAQTQQLEYSGHDDNEGNGCCSILVSETTAIHENDDDSSRIADGSMAQRPQDSLWQFKQLICVVLRIENQCGEIVGQRRKAVDGMGRRRHLSIQSHVQSN